VRSFAALAATAIVAMVLQTTVFPYIPALPVAPNLMMVLAVYLGVFHRNMGGALGAFLLGYFLDAFSGVRLGINAFAFTLVFASVQLVARSIWVQGSLPVIVVVFVAGCVRGVVMLAILALAGGTPLWQHVVWYTVVESMAAALTAPAVFAAVHWEKRALGLT
jgi:rod shape-determining protein MreD